MSAKMEFTPPPLKSIREVQPNSFIFEQHNALSVELCREMIERFEQHTDEQYPGRIGQTVDENSGVKKTTDLVVSGKEHWKDVDHALFQSLKTALLEFRETFPYFKGPFKDMGYGLQRYQPGEYYHWHIDGGSHDFAMRQLVALWYLNDVSDGGETEFLYQDIKVKPQTGKLILFPPFWTHEHRACVLEQGVKYIATTWVVFA
ncbi:2OG-Fe(II) oxygenase family protein [Thiohalophilus thiocyanatoxydans]|uniref:2-oxoglutarate-Fe(II)-dependent oxygenase superfamily protein n=1 Tax=Thiohalophilus thiocyanatoxydans TaxID=381308 RepID=A0A4R8IR04_9GAMM|nr:2OG-Fe(II) oxygenase [Thiohalophilus thiocyanatoxydans]TDY02754.1 2-oxoglutarate-Fe(II)-dependent oxygenase superfamily protein [Thiohalophilus thiocyanatoxydans]